MTGEELDVSKLILSELKEIKGEVRYIPKLQAQVDSATGATRQLETAMRETTAALQMQATAQGKLLDELRLQVHQAVSAMMGISNDVQSLIGRVRELEKQAQASFSQQQVLARQVREMDERDHGPVLDAHLDDYREIKAQVSALAVVVDKLAKQLGCVVEYMPFIRAWKYFVYTLGAAAVLMIVRVVLQLLLERGVVP
jgi:uncharacterized coiled-coil protein SlyX